MCGLSTLKRIWFCAVNGINRNWLVKVINYSRVLRFKCAYSLLFLLSNSTPKLKNKKIESPAVSHNIKLHNLRTTKPLILAYLRLQLAMFYAHEKSMTESYLFETMAYNFRKLQYTVFCKFSNFKFVHINCFKLWPCYEVYDADE